MGQSIDIRELYARHFGYVGLRYTNHDPTRSVSIPDSDTDGSVFPTLNDSELKSLLGTDIHFPVRIGLSRSEMFYLPNEPLINITGTNKIIRTQLTKLKGSVKERTQLSDYVVSISGVIINEESEDYPEEMVSKLRAICEAGYCFVESPILRVFNITNLAIEKWDITSREASQNEQDYSLSTYSDYPIELVITESNPGEEKPSFNVF